jgi:hypothetical protein
MPRLLNRRLSSTAGNSLPPTFLTWRLIDPGEKLWIKIEGRLMTDVESERLDENKSYVTLSREVLQQQGLREIRTSLFHQSISCFNSSS